MKTVASHALGCKVNQYESEAIAELFQQKGYHIVNIEQPADVYIINTCTVTNFGDKKSRQLIRKVKRQNQNSIVVVTGCYAQTAPEEIMAIEGVDIIVGTKNRSKIVELVENYKKEKQPQNYVTEIMKEREFEPLTIQKLENRTRAYLKIQDGCSQFCSYCIIPYARGAIRSRKPEDIINEIEQLVKNGTKEVMLLGQNVNSYGKNLQTPLSFAKLLQRINDIDGLERIRFMTSHPKDLSDELIETIKNCKKVCNYIHLPIQSGSSAILKKMNRRYTKEQYLELVKKLKNAVKDITISTDIIVGFPGETEEDFQQTLDVVRQVKYCTAFTFIYSKRSGTPAAKMENQIPEEIVKDRFNRLLDVLNPIVEEIHKKQVGTIAEVLVEEVSKQNSSILTGRTENNTLVHFEGEKELIGTILPVKIIDSKTFYVIGERV